MKKILVNLTSIVTLVFSLNVFATNKTFQIKFNKEKINLPAKPLDCSNLSNISPVETLVKNYNGSNGWDGSVQIVDLPQGTQCVQADIAGGGGGYYLNNGGSGDLLHATFKPTTTKLYLVVAGYSSGSNNQNAGGGGLSGIFYGQPIQSTAIAVASGGGSGGNISAGFNGGQNPQQPVYSIINSNLNYMGYGAGEISCSSYSPIPFSNGDHGQSVSVGFGGYGGGALKCGSDPSGSGMPGGKAGGQASCNSNNTCLYSAGGGGESYCSSNLISCVSEAGNGGAGGTSISQDGKQGKITLRIYK